MAPLKFEPNDYVRVVHESDGAVSVSCDADRLKADYPEEPEFRFGFTVAIDKTIDIHDGLSETDPWLARVAYDSSTQQYRAHQAAVRNRVLKALSDFLDPVAADFASSTGNTVQIYNLAAHPRFKKMIEIAPGAADLVALAVKAKKIDTAQAIELVHVKPKQAALTLSHLIREIAWEEGLAYISSTTGASKSRVKQLLDENRDLTHMQLDDEDFEDDLYGDYPDDDDEEADLHEEMQRLSFNPLDNYPGKELDAVNPSLLAWMRQARIDSAHGLGGPLKVSTGVDLTARNNVLAILMHRVNDYPNPVDLQKVNTSQQWRIVHAAFRMYPEFLESILAAPSVAEKAVNRYFSPARQALFESPSAMIDAALKQIFDYVCAETHERFDGESRLPHLSLEHLDEVVAEQGFATHCEQAKKWHHEVVRKATKEIDKGKLIKFQEVPELHQQEITIGDETFVVVQMLSNRDLKEETVRMKHCVATYSKACYDGACVVFSIRDPKDDERPVATFDVDRHFDIEEISGYDDAPVDPVVANAVRAFVRTKSPADVYVGAADIAEKHGHSQPEFDDASLDWDAGF